MNITERAAYEWLQRERGYAADEITFRSRFSPDFLTSDGRGYEVKLVRHGTVTFFHSQVRALAGPNREIDVLLWRPGATEPLEVWPYSELEIPGQRGKFRLILAGPTEDAGSLNIRGIDAGAVEKAKRAAGARGWAVGQYVERLVALHEVARQHAASCDSQSFREAMRALGLEARDI